MTSRQLARALRRAQARVETKQPRFENAVRLAIRDSIRLAARHFEQRVTSFVASTGEPPGWSPPSDDELLSLDEVMSHYRGKTDPVRNSAVNDFFDAFGDEAERNGVRANWHVSNPLVAAELNRTGSQIVEVSETTRRNVRGIVHRAYQDGLSVKDTAAAIREYAGGISVARSVLIARTEFVGLVQGGQLAATQIVADATGTPYLKVWRTAPGAEYPRHELYDGLDGQTVPINGLFDVGSEQLRYPGDPDGEPGEICNCRCSLDFVTEEEAQEQLPQEPLFTPSSEPQAVLEPRSTIPSTGELSLDNADLLGDGGNVNLVYLVERDGEQFVVKPKPEDPMTMRENIPAGYDVERETSAYSIKRWIDKLNPDLTVDTPELVRGTINTGPTLSSVVDDIRIMWPDVEVVASEQEGSLTISLVRTAEGSRGMGYATNAVDELLKYADTRGLTTVLTAEPLGAGGLSKTELEAWYKRKGFVSNTGSKKDFRFRETLIRPPTPGALAEPELAAISRFVPNATVGFDSYIPLESIADEQINNGALYDAIIGNLDRHEGNYMITEDGGDLVLIDNGLTFPVENLGEPGNARIFNERANRFGLGLESEEMKLLEDMGLHRQEIDAELRSNGLDAESIEAMWQRIDYMASTGEVSFGPPPGDIGPIFGNEDPLVRLNLVEEPGGAFPEPDVPGWQDRPVTPLGGQNPPEDYSLGVPTANVRYLLQDFEAQGLKAEDLNKATVRDIFLQAGYKHGEIDEARDVLLERERGGG